MLAGKGFSNVINLKGGIQAWNGAKAEGPVELNMDMITGEETPLQIIKLAYGMEQSLGDFYRKVMTDTSDQELASLLGKLASIEDKHKDNLLSLYKTVESKTLDKEAFESDVASSVLEGGFNADDFMQKNKSYLTTRSDLLDLSMMLEAQALDLYMRFAERMEEEKAREVLFKISNEEKAHLESLGRLREKS